MQYGWFENGMSVMIHGSLAVILIVTFGNSFSCVGNPCICMQPTQYFVIHNYTLQVVSRTRYLLIGVVWIPGYLFHFLVVVSALTVGWCPEWHWACANPCHLLPSEMAGGRVQRRTG